MQFGEQRLLKGRYGAAERLLYRTIGVADPAHYLHFKYVERALDSVPNLNPRRVMDAGCGRGDYSFYFARRFPNAQIDGFDIDQTLIQQNRETAKRLAVTNVSFDVKDLAAVDARDQYDLIVSVDVLEHIANQQTALRALAAALRPGGIAFFHVPTIRPKPVPFSTHLQAFHDWAEDEHIAEELTPDSFRAAVAATGLEVQQVTRTFGYYTGELATSLFALPFKPTLRNKILQGVLAPVCRALTLADSLQLDEPRYAVGILAKKPA